MNEQFDECLRKRKLVKFPAAKTFVSRELRAAENDLKTATQSLEAGNYKWATIQAYFSMFHCARALVYREGYREKSHFCLIVALRVLCLSKGLISHKVIEDIQSGKRMREAADYHADFSEDGARNLIKSAEQFLSIVRDLTKKTSS